MPEKWVILDAMGVIFEVGDDTNDLLVPYIQAKNKGISRSRINELYMRASLGEITSPEFWTTLGFGDVYPKIEQDYLDTCLRLDSQFTQTAKKLAEGFHLALLSNDVREWSAYLRARLDLEELFDLAVVSGEVGLRKPDEGIYRLLLDNISLPASCCVLVDDRSKNLRPASKVGLRTIRFAREGPQDDFIPDAEIRSFTELPQTIEKVLLTERNS